MTAPHSTVPRSRAALVATLATVVVLVAACSGDDSGSPTDSAASSTATTVSADSVADTTTTTATATTIPGPLEEWCVHAAAVRSLGDELDEASPVDPDEVRAAITALRDSIAAALDVAPDEVADAVATQLRFVEALDERLAETDYDMLTVDLSVLDEHRVDTDAAREVITAFNVEHCGFETSDDPGEADFEFGEGSLRDRFVDQLVTDGFTQDEAECIFAEIDFGDPDSYDDEEAVTKLFVACDIDLARIGELLEGGGQ